MAPNSLSPASVVIDYHSAYAPHKMTIPTKEWFPTSITGTLGSYVGWNGVPIDAEDMVNAFVDTMKAFLKSNAAIDGVTIYTQATATSPNIPRATKALTVAGVVSGAVNEAAVSMTYNFKTTANNNMKIVILDTPILTTWFRKVLPSGFDTSMNDLADEILSDANAWAGRDDNQCSVARSITMDLNDKLQRAYFK